MIEIIGIAASRAGETGRRYDLARWPCMPDVAADYERVTLNLGGSKHGSKGIAPFHRLR